jgi:hypothetical protein
MLNIFKLNKRPKKTLPFHREDMLKYIKTNRDVLNSIDNWIDEEAFSKSFFQYGAPDFIRDDINKKIDVDKEFCRIPGTYVLNCKIPSLRYTCAYTEDVNWTIFTK